MVKFSADIRATIGADAYFKEVEERYARCVELKSPVVRRANGFMMVKLPLKAALLFQTGLSHVVELTESFADDVNGGRFGADSADALLETASVLKDLQLRVEKVVQLNNVAAVNALDKWVTDVLTSRATEWGGSERDESLNTLTVIDRTRQEQMKTAVCGVGLALLLVITAIERYAAIETEFVRLCDLDSQARGGG